MCVYVFYISVFMDAHPLICNISAAKIISTSVQALAFHELPFLGFFFFSLVFFAQKQLKRKELAPDSRGLTKKFQVPLLTAHKDTDLLSGLKTLSLFPSVLCQPLPKTPSHTPHTHHTHIHTHTHSEMPQTPRPRSLVLNEDLKDLFPATY